MTTPPLTTDPLIEGLLRRVEELERDSALLDWLEAFLQTGSQHALSTRHQSEVPPYTGDDKTWLANPFSVGYEVETEHRGCYRWEELAKGEKHLREALHTARAAWEVERAWWASAEDQEPERG